ncbi:MAG: peptide deformylase [Desulfobacterales bacterium]
MNSGADNNRAQSLLTLPKLTILTYPEEILTHAAKPLADIDGRVQEMIDKMAEAMYGAPGVGLASIQVGWEESLLIYDISPRDEKRVLNVLVNPRIVASEGEMISENEGCLSVPDYRSDVKRAERVLVEGFDRHGKPVRIEADGLHAVVLQHEMDHLNGKLFIDRISSLKRELYKRRVRKALRNSDE